MAISEQTSKSGGTVKVTLAESPIGFNQNAGDGRPQPRVCGAFATRWS